MVLIFGWAVGVGHTRGEYPACLTPFPPPTGQGWRWWYLQSQSDYWHHCRPQLVNMQNVTHYTMEDVTIQDSPFWSFTARGLKDALFERVRVHTTRCGFGEAVSNFAF